MVVVDSSARFEPELPVRPVIGCAGADARLAAFLVVPEAGGLAEALLGYWVDREIGPLVIVAAGGTMAELLKDRSVRLAPVTMAVAQETVGDVRPLAGLSGLRGKLRDDLGALAAAVGAMSSLAGRSDLRIVECEVIPLIVRAERAGVIAGEMLARGPRPRPEVTILRRMR